MSTNTYVFALRNGEPIPEIQIFQTHVNVSPRGMAWGGGGRHSSEFLDRYAPESMKPVLARWRSTLAKAAAAADPSKPAALPTPQTTAPPEERAKWESDLAFVDLSKKLIPALRLPIISADGTIANQATILFGLTAKERGAILELFNQMRFRLEKLEVEHFERIAADQSSFVIHAFPEENAALRRQWLAGLAGLIETNRAAWFDQAMRIPPFVPIEDVVARVEAEFASSAQGLMAIGRKGPDWFERGNAEQRIDVVFGQTSNGVPTQRFNYHGSGTTFASFGFPIGQVPPRWEHLFTPGMLKLVAPPAAF